MIDLKLYKKDGTAICTIEDTAHLDRLMDEDYNKITWELLGRVKNLLSVIEHLVYPNVNVSVEDVEIGVVVEAAKSATEELEERLGHFREDLLMFRCENATEIRKAHHKDIDEDRKEA